MTYHVNPETGQASVCRAKVKCRFGGADGKQNHFESKAEAKTAAEAMLDARHAFVPVKKSRSKASQGAFDGQVAALKTVMARTGMATSKLAPVASEKEIIAKWFNGNRANFDVMSRLASKESELTQATKDSVSGFVKKGANVGFVSSVDKLTGQGGKSSIASVSEIDLIEELDDPRIALADLASGKLRAF